MDNIDLLTARIESEIESLDLQIICAENLEDKEKVTYLKGERQGLELVLDLITDIEDMEE